MNATHTPAIRAAIQINRARPAKTEDIPAPYEAKIAALIERETAAPELLAALEACQESMVLLAALAGSEFNAGVPWVKHSNLARAAIAKAKGEA